MGITVAIKQVWQKRLLQSCCKAQTKKQNLVQ